MKTRLSNHRSGVTLSEVLVSLLVMSVGVVAVATLFPLSVFRTIQATQLTNAAQLRYNFEGMAGARPEVKAGTEAWQPGRAYVAGDMVVSTSPLPYYFECTTGGTSFTLEPLWKGMGTPTVEDPSGAAAPVWTARRARVFVVDPMGWQDRTEDLRDLGTAPTVSTPNIRNAFGRTTLATSNNTVINPNYPGTESWYDSPYRIMRFRGGAPGSAFNPSNSTFAPPLASVADISARFGAEQLAVLPDSWLVQTDTTEVTPQTLTTLQLNNVTPSLISTLDRNGDNNVDLDLTNVNAQERRMRVRVTLFDATGRISHVRNLLSISGTPGGPELLTWLGDLPTSPVFTPVRARVETFEPRYTWMVTGRRNGPTAYRNLVVFFRRSPDPEAELIHPAHFNMGRFYGADDTWNTNDDRNYPGRWPGPNGTFNDNDDITEPTVVIQYHPDLGGQRPFLKRGGFICDSQNNRWYRVTSYREVTDAMAALLQLDPNAPAGALAASQGAVVKLDNAVLESSGVYNPDPVASNAASFPGAILMPGIIDVYPLQPELPWENE